MKDDDLTILCVGAHPDDCEFQCSGTAAKFAEKGARVIIVSVTDGRSGHHEMSPEETVKRRAGEAATGATIIGAESRILGAPDGSLEPTLENREAIIRLVREVKPDIIITNRPNDYHPDHRYTSLLIQDSSYMFMVPHVVPDSPPLDYNPVILFWRDSFAFPREIRPDVVVAVDDVFPKKLDMLEAHESQLFEWLPWIDRYSPLPPARELIDERRVWLKRYYKSLYTPSTAERFRSLLVERYGVDRGSAVVEAEVFEVCEYGAQPSQAELDAVFNGM